MEFSASGTDRTEGPDEFGYVVVWSADGYSFNFRSYAIMTWDLETLVPSFLRIGAVSSGDCTENVDEAQVSVSGYIKWDGCAEISFDDDPHWCGAHQFAQHIRLMAWLVNKAAAVLPNWYGGTIRLDVQVVKGAR